jgi:cellulose synthase/poly-beta-1,6-N-acetylglucosamine synthase-like glycosyltransferase
MIFVFYFFAAVLVALSYRSFLGGINYRRFIKSELAKPRPEYEPFVTVIVPCRGVDAGLQENLSAVIDQDYPDYEVIFVVDDNGDSAVDVIERTQRQAAKDAPKTQLIIAPKAVGCGQKVENLREAVLHADVRSKAFAFVDSDVRPSPDWLRSIIGPLNYPGVGAATGYRWFISPERNLASELRSVWNASIASALGPNPASNFCWGGSWSISRDVFERIDMRGRWLGILSDDLAVTRTLKQHDLPIAFVPQALTASIGNCTFGELIEFTTRQMKITRVYAQPLWLVSLVGSAIFIGVLLAAAVLMVSSDDPIEISAAAATIIFVSIFSIAKSWLRLDAVRLVLSGYRRELDAQFWSQNTLWLLTPAIFLFNDIAAAFSRTIVRRGITYVLKSPGQTVIIATTESKE